jgi:aldehyde dehydrogenase (NAD+)
MSLAEKFLTMEYGPAPEDPKDALLWLDGHKRRLGHFIGGDWREPVEGSFFDTTDPATGEKIAAVAQGSPRDVDAAVRAAREALPAWQALSPHTRARYLYAMARGVRKHSRRLAVLETLTMASPFREP